MKLSFILLVLRWAARNPIGAIIVLAVLGVFLSYIGQLLVVLIGVAFALAVLTFVCWLIWKTAKLDLQAFLLAGILASLAAFFMAANRNLNASFLVILLLLLFYFGVWALIYAFRRNRQLIPEMVTAGVVRPTFDKTEEPRVRRLIDIVSTIPSSIQVPAREPLPSITRSLPEEPFQAALTQILDADMRLVAQESAIQNENQSITRQIQENLSRVEQGERTIRSKASEMGFEPAFTTPAISEDTTLKQIRGDFDVLVTQTFPEAQRSFDKTIRDLQLFRIQRHLRRIRFVVGLAVAAALLVIVGWAALVEIRYQTLTQTLASKNWAVVDRALADTESLAILGWTHRTSSIPKALTDAVKNAQGVDAQGLLSDLWLQVNLTDFEEKSFPIGFGVQSVALSPNGKYFAAGGGNKIAIVDPNAKTVLRTITLNANEQVGAIGWGGEGTLVVKTTQGGSAIYDISPVFENSSGREIRYSGGIVTPTTSSFISSLKISPNGNWIGYVMQGRQMGIMNVSQQSRTLSLVHDPSKPDNVAFAMTFGSSKTDQFLAAANTLTIRDFMPTGVITAASVTTRDAVDMVWADKSNEVAILNSNGTILVAGLTQGANTSIITGPSSQMQNKSPSVDPTGKVLLTVDSVSKSQIYLWNLANRSFVRAVSRAGRTIGNALFSTDGRYIFYSSQDTVYMLYPTGISSQ